jgi:hypothetical protein
MRQANLTREGRDASRNRVQAKGRGLLALAASAALSGCVQVSAPERPIEINLNITIRQEVVVRLQDDARQLIQNNPGVF